MTSAKSRKTTTRSPTMNKKALTNTTPFKELPLEMFKHIESFLHPLNALALRATNKMSASTINTHNQAKHYLQQMFEHKGLGNLFIKNTAMRFLRHIHTKPSDKQRKAIAQAIASDNSEKGRKFMYDLIKKIITHTQKDDSALFVLSPGSMTSVSRHPAPNRVNISGVWT